MHSEALCRQKPVQDNNSDTTGGCSGKINYSDLFLLPLIQVLVFHGPTKFSDCSFSIAGPTAWNSLPVHAENVSSLEAFKSKPKTHLFKQQCYNCHQVFELVYSALSFGLGCATVLCKASYYYCYY